MCLGRRLAGFGLGSGSSLTCEFSNDVLVLVWCEFSDGALASSSDVVFSRVCPVVDRVASIRGGAFET